MIEIFFFQTNSRLCCESDPGDFTALSPLQASVQPINHTPPPVPAAHTELSGDTFGSKSAGSGIGMESRGRMRNFLGLPRNDEYFIKVTLVIFQLVKTGLQGLCLLIGKEQMWYRYLKRAQKGTREITDRKMADNKTEVTGFILLGFPDLQGFQIPVFLLFTLIYALTITGNALIVAMIMISHHLHSPMYFFLCHLSACDILISTNVVPNALQTLLNSSTYMSVQSCFVQLYFFGASAIIENCLLSVMSYDRYLAICDPLHYSSIMAFHLHYYLAIWSWSMGFTLAIVTNFLMLQIQFCGPNVIDHFFCDLSPLLGISCSDPSAVAIAVSVVAGVVGLLQFLFVIVTYSCIFRAIFQISTSTGRRKAFSTCSAHLSVVFTYYGSLISLNLVPSKGYSSNIKKALSVLNTMVTPLFNPIIYSLRNKDLQKALQKHFKKS
ncbi:olfactory receptor 6F1-like [Mantella aurantiaca]